MAQKRQDDWDTRQASYWDSVSPEYDSLYKTGWSKSEDQQTLCLLRQTLRLAGPDILELACGTGLGYMLCASIAPELKYVGVDISPEMVSQTNLRYPGLTLQVGSMSDLSSFATESFDVVISLNTSLSYSDDPSKTIHDVHRILRPEGRVLLSVLSRWSLRRILKRRLSDVEEYQTRGSGIRHLSTPAWVFSVREVKSMMETAGFTDILVNGQSVLGGIAENSAFWPVDVVASRYMPDLANTLNVLAQKQIDHIE